MSSPAAAPQTSETIRSGVAAVDRYLETGYATVPGMSSRFAAAICCGLLRKQTEMGVAGPIAEIGPFGDFLSHDATYRGMRGQSRSQLIDRRVREEWTAAGSTTMYDRALAEARRILETHVPESLPEEVAAKLKSIIEAAENELGVH